MRQRNAKRNTRGFTLTEVLLAVAILIVLMGLAMIPITRHQRSLRQTELDGKAETVYMAAQNRLAQLQSSGRGADYAADRALPLNNIPWDAEQDKYAPTTLYYTTSDTKENASSAANAILPQDQLEKELWDANWVIEYDPASGSVYAVFYSEKPMTYSFDGFNDLRSRDRRLQNGAVVGYYGGDSTLTEDTGTLSPKFEIENKERLLLKVTCGSPRDPLHFYVTITDSFGHSTSRMEITGTELSVSYRTYTATMVLDELTDGMRFSQQRRFNALTPGADLTIKVEVVSDSKLVDSVTGKLTTNSLFASLQDGGATAVVNYARHLQNLDKDSGLPGTVTAALQQQDIQFVNDGADDDWSTLYGGLKFRPIRNGNLTSYTSAVLVDGQEYHPVIYGLPVNTTGNGGLFDSFRGTLRSIRLCGANITASGAAGGLVGTLSGPTVIDGCQVYLSPSRDKLSTKTEKDIWLRGATVGGLVGECAFDLTVTNSFAASVLQGTQYTGGLVGYVSGSPAVHVQHSYADCYLYASASDGAAGGLIGGCTATADISLWECYAAGFLSAPTTAGLVCGELSNGDTLYYSYTACAPLDAADRLTYSTARPSSSAGTFKPDHTYYMSHGTQDLSGTTYAAYESWSGTNRATAVADCLNTAFTAETGGTVAYDLMSGMGLGAYSYPRLTGLTHYGDWQAQFESGALAYYEVYTDGSYGFRGANLSTLSDSLTVLGDGYGMVFHGYPDANVTLRFTLNDGTEQTYTLYAANAILIDKADNYYLLPLPDDLVNTTQVSPNFYLKLQADDVTYWFSPHFACRVTEGADRPDPPAEIPIRTARQLHALSLYYPQYQASLTRSTVFQQERPIDYAAYNWYGYGLNYTAVTVQQPIGASDAAPFTHIYDGGEYPITAVSFASPEDGAYAGLFGLNRGTLRNIVLLSGQTPRTVSLRGAVTLRTAYTGALAGRSEGTVYNCAAAGYTVSGDAYQGSILYLGGLVGYNSGTVRACSVSTPELSGSSNYARMYLGGLSGGTSGLISQSYAMADIEVHQLRGGDVALGGFTGENTGAIRSSYCATALMSPGADTYGFAPSTGSVTSCYYLSGGTFRFVGEVHLYDYQDASGARAVGESGLKALRLTGFGSVAATRTYHHYNTDTTASAYPYPGIVAGRGGSRVHYGDWVVPADLGTFGVVYWEREVGGSNPGYHFSYIGFENGVRKDGSSLCTAHDDGGKITDYGYGYYYSTSGSEPSLTASSSIALGEPYAAASDALEKQMNGLTFVAYRTSDTGLRLTSGTTGNGSWYLTVGTTRFTYTVSPFFADAYAITSVGSGTTGGITGLTPGTDDRPYQVRSVEQLQYINWSYIPQYNRNQVTGYEGSTKHDVEAGNWRVPVYKYYPYLQYTSSTGNATQSKDDALRGDSTGGTRPVRTWKQTHDLNGRDLSSPTDGTRNYDFHPIAGAVNDTTGDSYDMVLYNWFGSKYDGQSYYIKNININSYCYNVGLFGTTAGAEIKNIVLYSDNGGTIQRSTQSSPSNNRSKEQYITSYALGGLVGIAYDYKSTEHSTIENCAIAGYTVTDNSKNQQAMGEAAIGGLIGVSSVDLNKCSAVVTLNVNCTHLDPNGYMNQAMWGNYVRVGGLVGGLRYTATDCYTGGTITIGTDLLNERIVKYKPNSWQQADNKTFADPKDDTTVKATVNGNDGPDTFVYIGGVGGSGFSSNFKNFTSNTGASDGQPVYTNCYTYVKFPAMEGTISGISLVGSLADRTCAGGNTAALTVTNCYYLDSSASIDFSKLPKYHFENCSSLSSLLGGDSNADTRESMLLGNLTYVKDFAPGRGGSNRVIINGLTALSYEQMSVMTGANITTRTFTATADARNEKDFPGLLTPQTYDSFTAALGSSFHWVTTVENGAPVHGKYSFPGNDTALLGQDYPFPTVLTQTNRFGTAYLHYGTWPTGGLYWSSGMLSLDMITDYKQVDNASYVDLTLTFSGTGQATDEPVLTHAVDGIVSTRILSTDGKGKYTVRVTGLTTGSTEITATLGIYTARLLVDVTAQLNISVDKTTVEQYVGESATLTLSASDKTGAALTNVTWDVVASGNSVAAISTVRQQQFTVTGIGEGEDAPIVRGTVRVGTMSFTSELRLTVTIHMQGVLGLVNTTAPAAPVSTQGILTRDGSAFESADTVAADPVLSQAPYTDRPAPGTAGLYLYSQGAAADLNGFTVTSVTVTTPAAGTTPATDYDALSPTATEYRVTLGQATALPGSGFTVVPLTLRGRQAGEVTLAVTLRDTSGRDFTLSLPYTLTDADTKVTVTYRLGEDTLAKTFTKTVTFGGDGTLSDEELTALLEGTDWKKEDLSWSPDLSLPVYEDTVFTAVLSPAESNENTADIAENSIISPVPEQ